MVFFPFLYSFLHIVFPYKFFVKKMDQNFIRRTYIGCLFILCLSLFYYQVIKGNYYLKRAENNYLKAIPLRSIRGSILDRNSKPLAYDKASFNIAVIPYQIRNKKDSLFQELAKFLNYRVDLIYKNYNRRLLNLFSPVDLISDLDKNIALKIKEKFNDDVIIEPQPQRYYPYSFEFSHLLGYVKEATSFYENLKKYGYSPLERVGFLGVEQYYDTYLKGEDGGDLIEVNSKGKVVGFLGERKAKRGKDIYLTIEYRIQEIAYKLIEEKRGVIILMDSENGEIICLVSSPSFNLNNFIKGKDVSEFLSRKDKPMHNRVIQSTYPLGSTFKPIVATAALEEKKISPSTTFICRGKIDVGKAEFKCERTHEDENLYEGLSHSCNVYFYNLGMILGKDILSKWARKFGLDSYSGIDLPYEKKGLTPASLRLDSGKQWFTGDTVNLSIGQGYIESSPLEILLAINVFANGGYLVKPYLLKKVDDMDSSLSTRTYLGISQKNLEIVKRGLKGTVDNKEGTSHILKELDLDIAGKTGTAQTRGKAHGWFVGFFPYVEPKYSICVFLENAGSSFEALKVAHSFLGKLKEEKLLDKINE
jgi:penicillin-binding protein 2